MTTIEVGPIDPIGRDLVALPDRRGLRPRMLRRTTGVRAARVLRRQQHRHGAMLDPGVDGASEHRLHLLRTRTRRDIPVARNPPEETVAHTTTDRISLVARTLELCDDIFYIRR